MIGYTSFKYAKIYNEEKVIERINESDLPVLFNTGIGKNMSRILGKIMISNNTVGYIGVFEATNILIEEDIELTQILCSVMSVELSKNPVFTYLTNSLVDNLLIDLLNGVSLTGMEIKNRLKSSSCRPLKNFYIVYIPIMKNSTAMFKIENLRFYLIQLSPFLKTVYIKNSIILLMNFDDNYDIKRIWDKIISILANYNLKAGTSFQFSNLEHLKIYYEQAVESYNYGSVLNVDDVIHFYKDYYYIYLLNKLKDSGIFCMTIVIKKLLNYMNMTKLIQQNTF